MDHLNITIDGLVFDRADYDADDDVLYLTQADGQPSSDAALTPEGHGIRYGPGGDVIGVTIINARAILGRDGHITITLPHEVHVGSDALAAALG
jgi:uncharacterized protein YuzE